MKNLQEIRTDVVRMGKEIKVDPIFEEKFKELNEYLKREFKCSDFELNEYELDKIDNSIFESTILKFAICKAFGIAVYSGVTNPWFRSFYITRSEESLGYHGSASDTVLVKYDLEISKTIGYEIYNLLSMEEEQICFIKSFKERHKVLKEKLEKIKSDIFPIEIKK